MAPMIGINMSMVLYIVVRHFVVVSVLSLVLQRVQDWYNLVHHHFIIYMLHWVMHVSTSLYLYMVAAQSLKYALVGLLWCDITGVTGYCIG